MHTRSAYQINLLKEDHVFWASAIKSKLRFKIYVIYITKKNVAYGILLLTRFFIPFHSLARGLTCLRYGIGIYRFLFLPAHVFPSPENPALQEQI